MYTIISGTNRVGSHTERVAKEYKEILKDKNIEASLFSLKGLNVLSRNEDIKKVENEILIPTQKFIFIIPEYNGSYPGVLKALIDNSDIRNVWNYKKALLTGVATGRAGNLRGMDHLSDTLHYMKMNVFYNKLPISVVDKVMNQEGHLNAETIKVINQQLDEFIQF
ncbi:MAG: NADPH-dependent FMN reductase [Ginsengibacter sp.]